MIYFGDTGKKRQQGRVNVSLRGKRNKIWSQIDNRDAIMYRIRKSQDLSYLNFLLAALRSTVQSAIYICGLNGWTKQFVAGYRNHGGQIHWFPAKNNVFVLWLKFLECTPAKFWVQGKNILSAGEFKICDDATMRPLVLLKYRKNAKNKNRYKS